jgi:hypothetical protein
MTDQPRAGKAHRCPHRSPRRSPCVPHRHRVARPPRAAAAAAAPGPMIMRNTPIRTPQVRFCSARGIRSPSAPLRAGRRASVSSMRASGSAASGSSGTAAWTPRAQQPVAGSAVPSGCAADLSFGVQQFKDITDADAAQHAALGAETSAVVAGASCPDRRFSPSPCNCRPAERPVPIPDRGSLPRRHRAIPPRVTLSMFTLL